MGTTPNGLPFPESTDDMRLGAADMQALAEAIDPAMFDTGWVSIASALISPATGGGLEARRLGDTVEIIGNVSGSFVDGGITNIVPVGGIPAQFCPDGGRNRTAVGYGSSGYPICLLVRPDGSLGYWMRQGVSARSSVQFSIAWTAADTATAAAGG